MPETPALAEVSGQFVELDGGRGYCISHYDRLAPFLMTVVSASDLWLFISSTGGLTAGRCDVDGALFPYAPVDRIHDAAGVAGAFTCLLVTRQGRTALWEPFASSGRRAYRLTRHLTKSIEGHRLAFEEVNHDLGLTFRAEWSTSERFGFVRRATLHNDAPDAASVRVLDGLRGIVPAGVPRRLQESMSCLTDAYKLAEIVAPTSLAVYALTAAILDQAVAMESLRAAVAWSDGLPGARVLLTEEQVAAFCRGEAPVSQSDARGVRGLYAVCSTLDLPAGGRRRWMLVADQGLDQPAVARLEALLREGAAAREAWGDVEAGGRRLRGIVGIADGVQCGGDEMGVAHHFANVLFNVMRGGVFLHGYAIPARDFGRFLAERNRAVAATHAGWLAALPAGIACADLEALVRDRGDADLERLFLEYLPLGFSRRHGDPSRPWNRFSIRLRGPDGDPLLEYQGNWRDIFQNWEALGASFPGYLGHMVAKFVNGSTADGYNAYRVTRAGVEWEEPAPEDPWATIGYWGDHQVAYLLALLESSERHLPGRCAAWLDRPIFAHADVPYRIAGYDAMRRDPRCTITFLADRHAAILEREAREGADGRLVRDARGAIVRVTLAEKLLLVALVRLGNLVPGGGIWMNTQRPEWNDANNALAGPGVSVVTLAHLRRYVIVLRDMLARMQPGLVLTAPVEEFCRTVTEVMGEAAGDPARVVSDPVARRSCLDRLARAAERHRARVYAGDWEPGRGVETAVVVGLLDDARLVIDASLRAARREDGLFHAYRLLRFVGGDRAELADLPLMLEGQVALLGSGLLQPDEAVTVLRALRASALYREDQHTYLLQPDGCPPGFLQRNVISDELAARTPLLGALLEAGDTRLVVRDAAGRLRFHADLVNAAALDARLERLAADGRWSGAVQAGAQTVRAAYDAVFRHGSFLGRSGTMFAYEGLGSVYWHMVSKLLVAIEECHRAADTAGHPAAPELAGAWREVNAGLGCRKPPARHGAFPADPCSHTPRHAGAQQPGMTGQAKEGVLVRRGELGVHVEGGAILFAPTLLEAGAFTTDPRSFSWIDASGVERSITIPSGALAFTLCGTLVVYHRSAVGVRPHLVVTHRDGGASACERPMLSPAVAREVFMRTGTIARIDVHVVVGDVGLGMHNGAQCGAMGSRPASDTSAV